MPELQLHAGSRVRHLGATVHEFLLFLGAIDLANIVSETFQLHAHNAFGRGSFLPVGLFGRFVAPA